MLTPFIAAVLGMWMQPPQGEAKPIDVPLSEVGTKFRLIGKLGEPLGTIVKVEGVFVEVDAYKNDQGGPNLRVHRINGRATQEDIQICLRPLRGEFGDQRPALRQPMPNVKTGQAYEFEGYETGEYRGIPGEVLRRIGPRATPWHYFRHELLVFTGKSIELQPWSPADFVDREALIVGRAVDHDGKAYLEGAKWKVLTDGSAPWPKQMAGKTVEAFGTYRKTSTANEFTLEKGTTRLEALKDQVGQRVSLRGTAISHNGDWWFDYRGTKVHVEGMGMLPGMSKQHFEPVLIEGVLEGSGQSFLVRKPTWKPIKPLLSPERPNW